MDVSNKSGILNGYVGDSGNKSIRACVNHFHPSVVDCNSNGKHTFKIGVSPTVCSSKFLILNNGMEENRTISRLVGRVEHMQHVFENGMKHNDDETKENVMVVPPTIE